MDLTAFKGSWFTVSLCLGSWILLLEVVADKGVDPSFLTPLLSHLLVSKPGVTLI